MIVGVVTADREATINLVVIGPTGRDETVEAVIDTGFDGYLALPPAVIARLELPWRRLGTMMLGDGSTGQFDVHEGGVIWDDQVVRVAVEAVDICPLVGMALLANYELKIEIRAGGRVIIEALP